MSVLSMFAEVGRNNVYNLTRPHLIEGETKFAGVSKRIHDTRST